jgi:hypothetical protein
MSVMLFPFTEPRISSPRMISLRAALGTASDFDGSMLLRWASRGLTKKDEEKPA